MASTNEDKPFEPGEKVEFCGERATVVKNYGSSGVVNDGEDNIAWHWVFQGEPVVRVED